MTQQMKDVGGLDEFLARLKAEKKVARLTGADEKGNRTIEFPSWFERTGIRSFRVDTGLGVVACRIPRDTIDAKGDDLPEEQTIPLIVRALVKIPEFWLAEEDLRFVTEPAPIEVKEGQPLPQPGAVYTAPLDAQREYLHNLPRSLPAQVFLGLGYMSLPPLPVDPTTSA